MNMENIFNSCEEDGYESKDSYYEIKDPQIASAIFRNIFNVKKSDKKQKNADLCKSLYSALPEKYQLVVNRAIDDLLPQEAKQQHFGQYLTYMLNMLRDFNGNQVSLYRLATFIYAKQECFYKRDKSFIYIGSTDDIHGKLKSFIAKNKYIEGTDSLELELCDLLCFEAAILDTGEGNRTSLNQEKIAELLEERGMDSAEFYAEVVRQFVECSTCKLQNSCDVKGKYIESKQFDYKGIGEKISEILHIELEEIIEDSYIILEPESYPWEKYYCKLSKEHQIHINNLIRNLCMIVKSDENK